MIPNGGILNTPVEYQGSPQMGGSGQAPIQSDVHTTPGSYYDSANQSMRFQADLNKSLMEHQYYLNETSAEKTRQFNANEAAIAREFNSAEAEKARVFNSLEAQKARDFSEMQRSTQYQTTVEDLKAAGLNPALAYQNGGSGVSPSAVAAGSAATGTASTSSNASVSGSSVSNPFGSIISSAISSAASMANAAASIASNEDIANKDRLQNYIFGSINSAIGVAKVVVQGMIGAGLLVRTPLKNPIGFRA